MRTISFLAGALCGGLVGAVAALLLAPMAGKELKSRVMVEIDHVVGEARQAAVDKRAELSARFGRSTEIG
ncbi:MAG: YtxH domain-containing protein [Anaerolineales bacterium]|jgi:gas vesicle protein|nr:YtxH domain-containing protein [Anaerolineales bacterium]